MAPPSAVEVVRVEEKHAGALAEFFRQVWDPGATAETVRRARAAAAAVNPLGAGEDVPTFAFLSEGRALGYVTTIPAPLWSGGTEHRAHWVKGLWVLPEHRNGPIGFLLLKEAVRHLGCAMAMVVAPAPRRLFGALGFRDLGALPNHLRILRPTRVLRRLELEKLGMERIPGWAPTALRLAQRSGVASAAGAGAALALRLWSRARGRSVGFALDSPAELDAAEVDRLWQRARDALPAVSIRDGRTLRWRYGGRAEKPYTFVAARRASELAAVAVVRHPRAEGDERLAGLRVAVLSEVIFPPGQPRAGLAAIAGAERAARDLGADALLCSASHPALAALLPRRAFLRLPGNVHFMARDDAGACALPQTLEEWWLTRGDSDADDSF